ncbi:hypothetical protein DFS34DRAFT_463952 [Phlyctochytrium arcticum]|nr:hypothetical protein DFS34DRAFT_463952 [Phlyctochytrium arcticum]
MAAFFKRWMVLALLHLIIVQVLAWDQEDFDVFDLTDALKKANGPDTDFYSVFNISKTATTAEINKAYRKLSVSLHPDKNPTPEAETLYTLLTSVVGILKNETARERYDRHLKGGFPIWRGTGYYYNHYKPGVGAICVILIVAISFIQYASGWLIYHQRKYHHAEMVASINSLSPAQVRRQLKKRDSPLLDKKSLKNATPVEILREAGELPRSLQLVKPSPKDMLIVQLPLGVVRLILSLPRRLRGEAADTHESQDESGPEESDTATDISEAEPVVPENRRMRRQRKRNKE